MTLSEKLLTVKSRRNSYHSERIYAELAYAQNLSTVRNGEFDDVINDAADFLTDSLSTFDNITKDAAYEAERRLLPLSAAAKSYKIRAVGHAHIDMNWMWGYQETASLTVDTFRTVLELMKQYPGFTFAQSQASTYQIIEKFAPEMLPEIKARIAEGRWEVSASTWVETDKNMPSGESLLRHILYTKRYLSKLLDISPDSLQLDFEPDTFGHNIATPDICAAGGVKYYYHCRGLDCDDFIYKWRGRSAGELLVYREPKWYNAEITSDCLCDSVLFCGRNNIDVMLKVYGVGDHGGGPTRRDVERLVDMMSWPVFPTITFGTFHGFFKELEQYSDRFPTREGELNYVFTGCYTSQSRIKRANRIAETRLYEAEALSAMAHMLGATDKAAYYEKAWENVLFNHFHDILPGSGVIDTREYALGHFQDAMSYVTIGGNASMRYIADKIGTEDIIPEQNGEQLLSEGGGVGFASEDGSGHLFPRAGRGDGKKRAFAIFNPTSFDYDGVTELTAWDWLYDGGRAYFTDASGAEAPHKLTANGSGYWGHRYHSFAVRVKVPAFGYSVYTLDERAPDAPTYGSAFIFAPDARTDGVYDSDIVLDNGRIRAVFSRGSGKLLSLVKSGRQLLTEPTASYRLITESSSAGMTSWRVGTYMCVRELNNEQDVKITDISACGVRKSFSYTLGFGSGSRLDVKVSLDDASDTLRFDTRCDFHETGNPGAGIPQLNFELKLPEKVASFVCDVPFGTLTREAVKLDVPALSYAAAGELMLMTDSKYGCRCDGEVLSVDLLRGSYDPDPYPEFGIHNMSIGVAAPDCRDKAASEFVHPLPFAPLTRRAGELPLQGSFLRVEGKAGISALKCGEDGGLILRLYDRGEGSVVRIRSDYYEAVALCDANENKISALYGELTLLPHEISTVLLKRK